MFLLPSCWLSQAQHLLPRRGRGASRVSRCRSSALLLFICRSLYANEAHVQCLCVHVRDTALTPGQVRKIISYRLCRTELDEELGALPRQR